MSRCFKSNQLPILYEHDPLTVYNMYIFYNIQYLLLFIASRYGVKVFSDYTVCIIVGILYGRTWAIQKIQLYVCADLKEMVGKKTYNINTCSCYIATVFPYFYYLFIFC